MGFVSRVSVLWRSFQREEQWALTLCAIVALLCAGMQKARPSAPLPPIFIDAPAQAGQSHVGRNASSAGRVALRIHVAGAVHSPGVQRLPQRARVVDAVRAAGGQTRQADMQTLNLAAHLQEGAQILVPLKGRTAMWRASDSVLFSPSQTTHRDPGQETRPAKAVNVNTATIEELETLPEIGPAIAQRIIQHRAEKGRFESLQDLDEVNGIGTKKLEQLQPYVIF